MNTKSEDQNKLSQDLLGGGTASTSGLPSIASTHGGSQSFKTPGGGDVAIPEALPDGRTAGDVQKAVTGQDGEGISREAFVADAIRRMDERADAKTPEQVRAEELEVISVIGSDIKKQAQDGVVTRASDGSPIAEQKPKAGAVKVDMTVGEMFSITGAIRQIKGISSKRRNSMMQSVLRLRRGEATEADYYTLVHLRQDSPYKRSRMRVGLEGGIPAQEVATSWERGGHKAEETLDRLLNEPVRDVAATITGDIVRGDFKDSTELYEFIGSKTTLPPQIVAGGMMRDELNRFRSETGAKSFDIENPNYPMLSAMLKIQRNEAEQSKLETSKDLAAFQTDEAIRGAEAQRAARLKDSKDLGTFQTNESIRKDTWKKATEAGVLPSEYPAYLQWMAGRGLSTPNAAYAALFRKESGKIIGAKTETGISTGAEADPYTNFKGSGSGRYSPNAVDDAISKYSSGVNVANTSVEDYRDGLFKAVAKAIPSASPDRARELVGSQLEAAVVAFSEMKDIDGIKVVEGEIVAGVEKMTVAMLNNQTSANVISTGGDSNAIFVDRETFAENIAAASGWSDDLMAEVMDENASKSTVIQGFKIDVWNTYDRLMSEAAPKLAAERDTNPFVAKYYFKRTKAVDTETGEPVILSDTGAILEVQDSKILYPMINIPGGANGDQLRKMNTRDLPDEITDRIDALSKNPAMFRQVNMEFGGTTKVSRVYDGQLFAAHLFGIPGDDRFPGIIKRLDVPDSITKLLPKDDRHLAYQINEKLALDVENPETAMKTSIKPDEMTGDGMWAEENAAMLDLFNESRTREKEGDTTGKVKTIDNVVKHLAKKFTGFWSDDEFSKSDIEREIKNTVFAGPDGQMVMALLESGNVDGFNAGYSALVSGLRDRLIEDKLSKTLNDSIPEINSMTSEIIAVGLNNYTQIGDQHHFNRLSRIEQLEVSISTAAAGSLGDAIEMAGKISDVAKDEIARLTILKKELDSAGMQGDSVVDKKLNEMSVLSDNLDVTVSRLSERASRGVDIEIDITSGRAYYDYGRIVRPVRRGE